VRFIGFAALNSLFACLAGAQTSTYVPPAPEQPLPFSHKQHVSNGLQCKDCHAMPDPGEHATFPATSKCMACHVAIKKDSAAIQKLADYHKKGEPVPWKRVYRVPDYVYFSHQVHVTRGKTACETCHGPVRERDVMRKEKPTSMATCVDCHKTSEASVACDYCHDQR
jgi:hypothetical protein